MICLLNLFYCWGYLLCIVFTRAQKRKPMQQIKIVLSALKRSLCTKGTNFLSSLVFFGFFVHPLFIFTNGVNMVQCKSSFLFLFFWSLCGPTFFFTIFIKSTNCFFFLCGPTWLLSLCSTFIFFHPQWIKHMEEEFENQLDDYVELDDLVNFDF